MALITVPGISSLGALTVVYVDAIANPAQPKLTEITSGTTALDLSCYLDNKWSAVQSKQNVEKDERLCSKVTYGVLGPVEVTFDDLLYVVDPQNPASVTSKASKMLTSGKSGYLVLRWGKDVATALAVGDIVDVYPVQLGYPVKVKGDGNAPLKQKQGIVQTGAAQMDVAVVA